MLRACYLPYLQHGWSCRLQNKYYQSVIDVYVSGRCRDKVCSWALPVWDFWGKQQQQQLCVVIFFFVLLFLYTVNYSDETKVEIPRVAGLLTFTILRPLINSLSLSLPLSLPFPLCLLTDPLFLSWLTPIIYSLSPSPLSLSYHLCTWKDRSKHPFLQSYKLIDSCCRCFIQCACSVSLSHCFPYLPCLYSTS